MKCPKKASYEECEKLILKHTIEKIEKEYGGSLMGQSRVQEMVSIIETFLRKKKVMCYGGTAINDSLPKQDQFYDRELEFPDYDFFSKTALDDAKELADIYVKKGFDDVEAKAGVHFGTYKVFVNYIPVADITQIPSELFDNLYKERTTVNGVSYVPPDYLRMSMYLELSRPAGDVSRWEKVYTRLQLLNKHYPVNANCGKEIEIDVSDIGSKKALTADYIRGDIYDKLLERLVKSNAVFFGSAARDAYFKIGKRNVKQIKIPDFDVIVENSETIANNIVEHMAKSDIELKIKKEVNDGDFIPNYVMLLFKGNVIAKLYEPLACHSYNILRQGKYYIRIASIETMLSLYLTFVYLSRSHFDKERILCMVARLFELQQKNRTKQSGILKRYSMTCYGEQPTIESIFEKKSNAFKRLVKEKKRGTREWEQWFLKYTPSNSKDKVMKEYKKSTAKKISSSTNKMEIEINKSMSSRKTMKKHTPTSTTSKGQKLLKIIRNKRK